MPKWWDRAYLWAAPRVWWFAGAAGAVVMAVMIVAGVHGGLSGLPLATLGEICGDVLFAALVAPFVREAYIGREHERGFPYRRYLRSLNRAKSWVQLLDTFTFLLIAEDDDPAATEGVDGRRYSQQFVRELGAALDRDVSVEILLLDPACDEVERRARAVGIEPEVYRGYIWANIEALHNLPRLHPENGSLAVYAYSAPPGISLHRCDTRMWVSFYPLGAKAVRSPHLELGTASRNATFLRTRFHDLKEGGRDALRMELPGPVGTVPAVRRAPAARPGRGPALRPGPPAGPRPPA